MLQDVWLAIDERRYEQAESLLRGNEELFPTRAGQMALGYILAHTGRHAEARKVFDNLRQQHKDSDWEHIAVHQLGRVERLAKQHGAALDLFREERRLIEAGGQDPHKLAANDIEMAQCYLALEQFNAAKSALDEALSFAKTHDDPETLGRTERVLADLSLAEGHPDAAKLHLERALVAFKESEDEFAVRELETQLADL